MNRSCIALASIAFAVVQVNCSSESGTRGNGAGGATGATTTTGAGQTGAGGSGGMGGPWWEIALPLDLNRGIQLPLLDRGIAAHA